MQKFAWHTRSGYVNNYISLHILNKVLFYFHIFKTREYEKGPQHKFGHLRSTPSSPPFWQVSQLAKGVLYET